MNKKLQKKIFGFVFGMWMALSFTTPVAAQWTVWQVGDSSPTTFAQLQLLTSQLLFQTTTATATTTTATASTTTAAATTASRLAQAVEYIQTAQRWIATVDQYTTILAGNIRRFTSLKGVLSTLEKQLGLSDDTLKALADVGEIIRGAFTIKNQFLSLITTRLAMIESLEARARNGIFNPSADLADLEEYLQYSIGREAAMRVATLSRLKETDALLERLNYELEKVRAERTAKQKELDMILQQLGMEGNLTTRPRVAGVDSDGNSTTVFDNTRQSLSPDAVQVLTIRKGQLEEQIQRLIEQEQKLVGEIQARYESIQEKYDSAYLKGRYWNSVINGWADFDVIKRDQLENLIDLYGNPPTPTGTPVPNGQ